MSSKYDKGYDYDGDGKLDAYEESMMYSGYDNEFDGMSTGRTSRRSDDTNKFIIGFILLLLFEYAKVI